MKLWLDDRRDPPDSSWRWVRTPAEAIELLETGQVTEISFDHDLGVFESDGRELTGYEVVRWIEREVVLNAFKPPKMSVHSSNPPGRDRLLRGIQAVERAWARIQEK